MKTLQGIDGLRSLSPGSVLSIGNFDGFHLGHAAILDHMRGLRLTSAQKLAIATFEPHPLTVLRPTMAPPRLTTAEMKAELLANAGVDEFVTLPPSPEILGLTAEQFWTLLRDEVRPAYLVEGTSFNFGRDRTGSIERLREWTRGSRVQLHTVQSVETTLLDLHVVEISSSLTRWLISYGRVRDATQCLGRPYALRGVVQRGHGRGKGIGTPTANLNCGELLIPDDGVYAGACEIDGKDYPVALSIGVLPTFGDSVRQVEAHVIGFDGDLYDQTLDVQILDWLREQVKYGGLDALKAQIAKDIELCKSIANEFLAPA